MKYSLIWDLYLFQFYLSNLCGNITAWDAPLEKAGNLKCHICYYSLILCCGGFLCQTICAKSHLWIHALGNPSSSWLHTVKAAHSIVLRSKPGLEQSWLLGREQREHCPWHSETNIWTHRSFSNRKAIERQDRTMNLYSVETAEAPLQGG